MNDYICDDPGPNPCTIKDCLLNGNSVQTATEELLPGASRVLRVDNDPDPGHPTAYLLKLNLSSADLHLSTMGATEARFTIVSHFGSIATGKIREKNARLIEADHPRLRLHRVS